MGECRGASRALALGFLVMTGSSCSQERLCDCQTEDGVTESGIVKDFQYPERYAAVVQAAEGGDEKSIIMLVSYYANFPKTNQS